METNHTNSFTDVETLISNLQTEDARNTRMMHNMQKMMWGIAALYVLISAMQFIINSSWNEKAGAVLILIAFIVFALLFSSYYRAFKTIDYGLPTIEMLSKAVNRYKAFQQKGLFFLIPVIIEGVGLNLMMYKMLHNPSPFVRILIFQSGYLFLLVVGFLIGYLIWKKRQKPLRDHALALLKEIQS